MEPTPNAGRHVQASLGCNTVRTFLLVRRAELECSGQKSIWIELENYEWDWGVWEETGGINFSSLRHSHVKRSKRRDPRQRDSIVR